MVSLICLLGAGVGGFFLYVDVNESGQVGSGKPVGKVEKREAKVRRKIGSSFVWTNVQSNEELFRKDSIQTGIGSAALVRLVDGSVLDIAESSLVVMDDVDNLALGFLRGSAVIRKATGDTRISVGDDGKAKVETLPARLVKPESLTRFFVTGSDLKSVSFQWEDQASSASQSEELRKDAFVQISQDRRFSSNKSRTLSPKEGTPQEVRTELSPGMYYWRVLVRGVPQSETRLFKVVHVKPAQTVYPTNGEKVLDPSSEGVVQFRWVTSKGSMSDDPDFNSGAHHLEVAQDPEFRRIVSSEGIRLGNGLATLRGLPDGYLYWRIRSEYSELSLVSQKAVFSLKTTEPTSILAAPAHVKPEPGAVLNLVEDTVPLEASWDEVEGAEYYEVTIFQTAKAGDGSGGAVKKEVLRRQITQTRLSLKELSQGNYTWTIRAFDKEKRPGEALPVRSFNMTFGDPLEAPEVLTPEVQ